MNPDVYNQPIPDTALVACPHCGLLHPGLALFVLGRW